MAFIAVEITQGNGRLLRRGHDENDPGNIPSGIGFETTMPGGYSTAQVTIPKPANLRSDDQLMFSPIRYYGKGGRTLYEGYITGISQTSEKEIQIESAGFVTWLDKVSTRELFVDRNLNNWNLAPSPSRQAVLLAFTTTSPDTSPTVGWDITAANVRLKLELTKGEVNPYREVWYDAGAGVKIASIYYSMTSASGSTEVAQVGVADDNSATNESLTADLLTGTNSSATATYTPTTARRFGKLTHNTTGTMTADSYTSWTTAIYGNHGLTKRGTAPEGFYASDIVRYVIGKVAGISTGTIEATSFVIPHLTYLEDTTIRQILEEVTALGGNQNLPHDWGIYDNRQFFWQSPGTYGHEWHVRKGENAAPVSDGPDADRRVSGVKIIYTDPAGEQRSVGPPGSNSDYETSSLLDTDKTNPAYKVPGFHTETMGITTQDGAVNAGVLILNDRNRLDWRGSITVTGPVEDALGNPFPAALVRAGDRIVVEDDKSSTEPRTITSTSYSHDTDTVTCSIGAKPDSLDSLLGQLSAVTDLIPV